MAPLSKSRAFFVLAKTQKPLLLPMAIRAFLEGKEHYSKIRVSEKTPPSAKRSTTKYIPEGKFSR